MRTKMIGTFVLLFLFLTACSALQLTPSAESEFEKGLSLFQRGEYGDAVPHFQKATELDPEYSKAYLYLGRSLLNLGKWREAIAPLRTALELSPDQVGQEIVPLLLDALYGGALFEFKSGNFKGSLDLLREALKIDPGWEKAAGQLISVLLAYGKRLLEEGRIDEAVKAFGEVLERSPDELSAYIGLAKAYFQDRDFRQALDVVRKAMKLAPNDGELMSLFMELLQKKK